MKTPPEQITEARALLMEARDQTAMALRGDNTRRRGAHVRRLHELNRMLLRDYRYLSQAGQDAVVDQIMGGKRGGTFADIGGYDGWTGSNTAFFELHRGWTGVLVEPVPAKLELAQACRRCPCLGVAVAPEAGDADFIEVQSGFTQMSGLAATYETRLLQDVRSNPDHAEARLRVETRPLSRILTDAGLTDVDYISLDIEGAEIATLESFPFADHAVGIWSIENNTGSPRIGEIMRDHGYELVEFCGPDDVYRNTRKS